MALSRDISRLSVEETKWQRRLCSICIMLAFVCVQCYAILCSLPDTMPTYLTGADLNYTLNLQALSTR
ncbi:hypothetical protein DL95DRAFT_80746 [Leptodontidium sp. 2 PMI_412]|nr:hypothetical protein DL95DRAFT_80746 [Leptodontidium sp. 2 PMI_412]